MSGRSVSFHPRAQFPGENSSPGQGRTRVAAPRGPTASEWACSVVLSPRARALAAKARWACICADWPGTQRTGSGQVSIAQGQHSCVAKSGIQPGAGICRSGEDRAVALDHVGVRRPQPPCPGQGLGAAARCAGSGRTGAACTAYAGRWASMRRDASPANPSGTEGVLTGSPPTLMAERVTTGDDPGRSERIPWTGVLRSRQRVSRHSTSNLSFADGFSERSWTAAENPYDALDMRQLRSRASLRLRA